MSNIEVNIVLEIILTEGNSGRYIASFKEFPQIVAEGENAEEAKTNLSQALREVLEYRRISNELIGSLSIKNTYLSDSEVKRKEWLRKAKKEAGFPDSISFDIVWETVLKNFKEKEKYWVRYCFETTAKDYFPIISNPYPWWFTAQGYNENNQKVFLCVAFLPRDEELSKYWREAKINFVSHYDKITFTDRFTKPK